MTEDIELDDTEAVAAAAALILVATAVVLKKRKQKQSMNELPREEKIEGKILETSVNQGEKSHYLQLRYGNSRSQDKEQLINHLRNKIHNQQDTDCVECSECGEQFDTPTGLEMHQEIKHK